MLFKDLNLIMPIQEALKTEGYDKATPIQEKAIPSILAGRDLLGCARTGTGKTAAFAIPILQKLSRERKGSRDTHNIRALILSPTRELAVQIGESFKTYGQYLNLKTIVVFGGVSQNHQIDELNTGVDILVATPGRLLDLIDQGSISISNVEIFVLDEADRMLDIEMVHDVERIIAQLPKKRQNMLFSATMPQGVSQLVNSILVTPVRIKLEPESSDIKSIRQVVYFVDERDKIPLLIHLLKNNSISSALVFTRTKKRADKVFKSLEEDGIKAAAIHGDKSQSVRQATLDSFKNREFRILVATDVAARGIDVEGLSHVINFDLPNIPETYVHRIGRTGRAGRGGSALSLCNPQEKAYLKDIQKIITIPIRAIQDHPYSLIDLALDWNKDSTKTPRKPPSRKPVSKAGSGKNGKKPTGKQWPKKGKVKNKYQR